MAWLSSEGGVFDLLQCRYSNGNPNLDPVLKAHSGDPERADRGSRPAVYLRRTLIDLCHARVPCVAAIWLISNAPAIRISATAPRASRKSLQGCGTPTTDIANPFCQGQGRSTTVIQVRTGPRQKGPLPFHQRALLAAGRPAISAGNDRDSIARPLDAAVRFERVTAEHDAFVQESLAGMARRFGIKLKGHPADAAATMGACPYIRFSIALLFH